MKIEQLQGMAVVSVQEAERLGRVEDVYLDLQQHRLAALDLGRQPAGGDRIPALTLGQGARRRRDEPATGGALLVCNHVSYIDWLLLLASQRRHIRFVVFAGAGKRIGVLQTDARIGLVLVEIAFEERNRARIFAPRQQRRRVFGLFGHLRRQF